MLSCVDTTAVRFWVYCFGCLLCGELCTDLVSKRQAQQFLQGQGLYKQRKVDKEKLQRILDFRLNLGGRSVKIQPMAMSCGPPTQPEANQLCRSETD